MARTRVGYAGGTTADPTYRSIGDHTETLQLEFDPAVVSFEQLLDIFWSSHRPTSPPYSRQYASLIFYHDDSQRELALASAARVSAHVGLVHTEIVPATRFYAAEDYHQKYRLRNTPRLYREFRAMYPDLAAFRESTAAARVNGYLDGYGTRDELKAEIDSFGLSAEGAGYLTQAVSPRGGRLGVRL